MIYTVTLNPSLDRTLHFPRLQVGQLNRATASRTDLGGKGINVSVALRELGLETVMMGFVAGGFGRLLVEGLEAQGYDCRFVMVPGETRSNVTVIDDGTGETTKLNEAGPEVGPDGLARMEAALEDIVSPGDWVVLAGSLPPGLPLDSYAGLIGAIKAKGGRALLDTSGAALKRGAAAGPELIKPNALEAEQLSGHSFARPVDWIDGLREILERGVGAALLTLGEEGAVYATGEGIWRVEAPAIEEISAIGAGDASLAGLLYGLAQDLRPDCVARWAVAAGSAAAQKDGTMMASRSEIEAMYERIDAHQID